MAWYIGEAGASIAHWSESVLGNCERGSSLEPPVKQTRT